MSAPDRDGTDPALAGAPLSVQKAAAWLAAEDRKPGAWVRKLAMAGPVLLLFGGLAATGLGHDIGGLSEGASGALFGLTLAATALSTVGVASWARPYADAGALVARYRNLVALGYAPDQLRDAGDAAAPGAAETPVDRMVARIGALAGPERATVADAARRAGEHARKLVTELDHLSGMQTGQPQADAALDAARTTLQADLSRTQARVAELYASLVDLQTGGPPEELRLATERLAAEVEVDAKLAAARRSASQRQG